MVWSDIDGWLKQHAPAVWDNLAPGARPSDLRELATGLQRPLSAAEAAAFAAHDGMLDDVGATFFTGFELPHPWMGDSLWLSCAQARGVLARSRSLWGQHWPSGGLPLASYAGSNGYLVVRDNRSVVFFDTEDGEQTNVASSLSSWSEAFADDLAAGRVRYQEDQTGSTAPGLVRVDVSG